MSEQLRYSDEELEEFRQIILDKIEKATALYEELCSSLNNSDGNDTADTSPTFKVLEEGANTSSARQTPALPTVSASLSTTYVPLWCASTTRHTACAAQPESLFPKSVCVPCRMPHFV